MLLKAFILSLCLVLEVNCNFGDLHFQDQGLFNDFDVSRFFADPLTSESRSVPSKVEREREPLAPDYKDPQEAKKEEAESIKPQESDPFGSYPGGLVVNVDASSGLGGTTFKDGLPKLPDFSFEDFGSIPNFGAHARPGGEFFPFKFFGPELKPWWRGPNVCVEREESTSDEDNEQSKDGNAKNITDQLLTIFNANIKMSHCNENENKYECITKTNNHGVVKTFTVRYKCCHGFLREVGRIGCTKEINLKSLVDTLDELGDKDFRKLISNAGLDDVIKNGNYTIFAPTDKGLQRMGEPIDELNIVRRRRDIQNNLSTKDLVLNHMTEGFVDLTDVLNEETITSEYNNNSIRINIYPTEKFERMLTANCARIKSLNNMATNGIIHEVEGVVNPATQSIMDIINEHPQLGNLRQAIKSTNIPEKLKPEGHYTLFAPTDEAFSKLSDSQRQKILNGDECAGSIFKFVISPHTVCSAAIMGNATIHNVVGEILNLERSGEDDITLEGKAKIIDRDIMATNGVVHIIDTIIIPDSALNIESVLKAQNLTKFQDLVNQAGLTEEINNLKNSTLFVPSDEALEKKDAQKLLDDIKDDTERLKEFVRYHTVQGKLESCDMNNNAILKSNDNGKELRLNLYSTSPVFTNIINKATLNCASLTGFDQKSCGSVIHEVDRVLVPPSKNILDLIKDEPKYSILNKIIPGTEIEKILKDSNQSISLLAPTDETFATLDEEEIEELVKDKKKANDLLQNHVLSEVLCCSGVGPQTWGFNSLVQTVGKDALEVGRNGKKVYIDNGLLTSCDNLATNGVVHTINRIIEIRRKSQLGFFLFDI